MVVEGPSAAGTARRSSAFVISITPFDRAGALDEEALRLHLRRMASAGIGVYVGGGGSGEGFTLSPAEATRVLEIGVEELKGKVPIRSMGVEPRTADEMVRFARMAQATGVDATQIYSLDQGHGHRPTGTEIETYLLDILGEVDLPVVLSSHQSVGYALPVDLVAGLVARFDQIIGVNSSHADLAYLAALIDAVGDRVDIHVGGPVQTLTALSLGAQGFLTSEANLAPRLCMSVLDCYEAGDARAMTAAFGQLVRLSQTLYGQGGIRATKAVLNDLGLAGGYPRKPQLPVSDATTRQVREAVDRLGLAAVEGWPAGD
jgi:4-hydroxy-tetrahydrodipicolinate synthase